MVGCPLTSKNARKHAFNDFMFCAVPTSLIRRYVDDPELLERVNDRIRRGADGNPVFDRNDSPLHNMWGRVTWLHHLTKFPQQYKK